MSECQDCGYLLPCPQHGGDPWPTVTLPREHLAVHANKTCEECRGKGWVPEYHIGPKGGTSSGTTRPCPSCTEVKS